MPQQIHTRVSDENAAYLDGLIIDSGLTRGQVLNMILDQARQLGWRIAPGESPRVTYIMS
jgi:hypothetical protein